MTVPTPGTHPPNAASIGVSLTLRPDRRLIRPGGSHRHVDSAIRVDPAPAEAAGRRAPVSLGIVIDRSGSMAGDKITTAKQAAIAVVDRLDARDRVALVVFDDQIDIVQPATPVNSVTKARLRAALKPIDARGSTALHEGWLTGCHAIAGAPGDDGARTTRCLLLTDGLANVGQTDPEQIAAEAASIREHTGIGTSTFGIGADYDENLLSRLANAGGGQFYHLREAAEMTRTFSAEIGDLLAVAVRQVRLDVAVDPGVEVDLVSQYWVTPVQPDGSLWSIAIGDLMAGEDRHLVIRFGFPPPGDRAGRSIRARLRWQTGSGERETAWQTVEFADADNAACDAEAQDPEVMSWVGLHHAERARRDATEQSRQGDRSAAKRTLTGVGRRIKQYAGADPLLQEALAGLAEAEAAIAGPEAASPMDLKEQMYQSRLRSRGGRDTRGG